MSEATGGPEQEVALIPNNSFKNLVHSIPPPPYILDLSDEEKEKVFTDRMDSEEITTIAESISQQLEHAKITSYFKKEIKNVLEDYLLGIKDISTEEGRSSLYFLDEANPESEGIFDPQRAVALERRAITEYAVRVMQEQEESENKWRGRHPGVRRRSNLVHKRGTDNLASWKEEFEVVHGESYQKINNS